MLSKLAVRRLTKLADYMQKLRPTRKRSFSMTACFIDKTPCGTGACAAGWASRVPSFRKAGYTVDEKGMPRFRDLEGNDALEAFFDGDVYRALFHWMLDVPISTPKEWAARCRKFLRDNT